MRGRSFKSYSVMETVIIGNTTCPMYSVLSVLNTLRQTLKSKVMEISFSSFFFFDSGHISGL